MSGISMLGCRENNLKNINVSIPYSKIVSFIGVSGSGKSTVVFDTLYAEGKRRYIESLGVNESYFLSKVKKPQADLFVGIPPAVALSQNTSARNPRSSVGSISQISYYLQLLFSSCGDNPRQLALTPSMFNLNSPNGVCEECGGSGTIQEFDETLIWPNQRLSMQEGGILLSGAKPGSTKMNFYNSFLQQYGFDINTPIMHYSNEVKVALLFGQKKNRKYKVEFPGIITENERLYKTTKSLSTKEKIEYFMVKHCCEHCGGTGYNPQVLDVTIKGKNIVQYMNLSLLELLESLKELEFHDYRDDIFSQIKVKFFKNIQMCIDLGVGYLSLARKATTLSGGELQRLKLISQISSEISGIVYVLDEPSSGLHMSDIDKILLAIKRLNQVGNHNTIVMVEHIAKMINASDYIVEMGPSAGENGGQIIAEGTRDELWNNPDSLSGKYLSGKCHAAIPNYQLEFSGSDSVYIENATMNNLKNVSVAIPLKSMVCITGVSGSGKTSLIFDSFYQSIRNNRNIGLKQIKNREKIKNIILCDQSPIGKSSRSCPATYMDFWKNIRLLFASQTSAKALKLKDSHFAFNTQGGRCEKCQGEGTLKVDMGFLPEMTVICDECDGKRFNPTVLSVKFKGLSIYDVLELSIDQAAEYFKDIKQIMIKLAALQKVGLGYIKLGQSTASLSGGECQRLKLACEIAKTKTAGTMVIFDEPTKGLHFEDVKVLISVMKELVHRGNSVIIVEHNLDVIVSSDYVIDLGPEGGKNGGQIICEGTPYALSKFDTPTGRVLNEYYRNY